MIEKDSPLMIRRVANGFTATPLWHLGEVVADQDMHVFASLDDLFAWMKAHFWRDVDPPR